MDDRSGKLKKIRVSVTMTKPYLDALDLLVKQGAYFTKGEIIMEALRHLLSQRGIEPFTGDEPQTPGEPH